MTWIVGGQNNNLHTHPKTTKCKILDFIKWVKICPLGQNPLFQGILLNIICELGETFTNVPATDWGDQRRKLSDKNKRRLLQSCENRTPRGHKSVDHLLSTDSQYTEY